ncbi:MFS transporter [Dysgonomonas sp. Marseille-P4361]|uniref:MFS transporter n=1 Tax=Dysgonomonas sp. Marseille-P4361 TaxID=2161820 RepID=UPI000D5510D9|nr:MFS transporter [Dysgonomonas sp. Marseille-P4361]
MTEIIRQKLNDSPAARWTVLVIVAFTMFCAYYINDVMAPLMGELGSEFGWTSQDFGIFNFSYGWLNVFLFMLIFSGIILDKIGPRLTGIGACILMVIGCLIKYYAVSTDTFEGEVFGIKMQVFIACVGFAIFALGLETIGITVTKIIARWFNGYETALAMGLQVAIARLGSALAIGTTLPLAKSLGSLSAPILIGLMAICIGLIAFIFFCTMDKKLDASIGIEAASSEDSFKVSDILSIAKNKGFWLIAILCVLFYSAVFPFLKFGTSLMINKFGMAEDWAGTIPAMLPFGTVLLTPIFGGIYDKKGKGATIMLIGAALLTIVHLLFSIQAINVWWMAAILMVLLGIAFSLVPSAMWPTVPKIIPQNQLGTAYGMIFWVQNIGLSGVPFLIGWILDKYCIVGEVIGDGGKVTTLYDYTIPMLIFACFGVLAVLTAFLLKREDKIKGYGIEQPNLKK